ncbi:MAG: enoyl-CoA hydratase-related protein, partial [Flavobacteriaceae bacterium]
MENHLIIEKKEAIGIIAIDRPSKLNALNAEVIEALSGAIKDFHSNPNIRVIILTGSGEKAFVAGADIAAFSKFGPAEGQALASQGQLALF